jgi:hypothetical protein
VKAKFSLGSVVATPGVLEAFRASGESPLVFLERHLAGDWGDVDEHDRNENELSSNTAGEFFPHTRSARM